MERSGYRYPRLALLYAVWFLCLFWPGQRSLDFSQSRTSCIADWNVGTFGFLQLSKYERGNTKNIKKKKNPILHYFLKYYQ